MGHAPRATPRPVRGIVVDLANALQGEENHYASKFGEEPRQLDFEWLGTECQAIVLDLLGQV